MLPELHSCSLTPCCAPLLCSQPSFVHPMQLCSCCHYCLTYMHPPALPLIPLLLMVLLLMVLLCSRFSCRCYHLVCVCPLATYAAAAALELHMVHTVSGRCGGEGLLVWPSYLSFLFFITPSPLSSLFSLCFFSSPFFSFCSSHTLMGSMSLSFDRLSWLHEATAEVVTWYCGHHSSLIGCQ